ncbi:MAG: glycosyl hydrolase, partial [Parabacteroides gordonii]|nr:glycosyl hydrolase [Parabacteroides gordonii]
MQIKQLSVYLLLLPFLSCAEPQETKEKDVERQVNALLEQMTLQEKIGQMNQLSPFGGPEEVTEQIRKGEVGSLLNVTNPEIANKVQK